MIDVYKLSSAAVLLNMAMTLHCLHILKGLNVLYGTSRYLIFNYLVLET